MKRKKQKNSKPLKPNEICDKIAPQEPECNNRQPTSCNQEHLCRSQNIDQSNLSMSANTTDNTRDVNQNNQTFPLLIHAQCNSQVNVGNLVKSTHIHAKLIL